MNTSITIIGTRYTVTGTVKNRTDTQGIPGLHVLVYDKDTLTKDDYLDTTTTDAQGKFIATFNLLDFSSFLGDRKPDLYFIVKDGAEVLLNTQDDPIKNADESTGPIELWVNDFDSNAPGAGKVPALGWVGGFVETNPDFAYPKHDLSSLGPLKGNMDNIGLLQRQQKVLWPEFSWETDPGNADSRCYTMFAPDISRLGYTNEGRVYSIICPQQGTCLTGLGCMNVEVTVTGNRGWADETSKALYADMGVIGQIWFSPSAHQNPIIKRLWDKFAASKLPFPTDKANAIQIVTYLPGGKPETTFPLLKGQTPASEFPIPDFAKHEADAWNVAHLDVEIGPIKSKNNEIVDEFNQIVLDLFNDASGHMLQDGNTLSWNVWFIAPQHVDQEEWKNHAEKWRKSIDADHGSPMGGGTSPRYFDGSPFKPVKSLLDGAKDKILEFEQKHF
ncbi:MAG: hypothetical protein R8G66_28540 [Cytophagales bacterium]|nr:hypothetical protein [Cytophagales bacterium]